MLGSLGWGCAGFRPGSYLAFKAGSPALYFGESAQVAPSHLAFKAGSEDEVRKFFRLALESGGVDHGPPGPRPSYGKSYYAAFVLDPDGHNLEAVLGGVS